MDVQSLTRLNRGVLTAGVSLDELGLSQRQVAGALQSGMIDAEGFGQSLREMRQNLGMSGEDIGSLLDEFTALGESVGEGEAFVRGVPTLLEGIREGVAEFPALRNNSRQLLTSLGRLARGMQQVSGSTPEEALGATNQVFQTLLGSRRNLRDLFSGMGSDFDDLATQLGIGGAGVGGALEMILSDPATFAVRAAELFEQSGGAGTVMGDRLTSVLSRMGPSFVRLVDGSEESTAALAVMRQEMGDTEGAFGRMAQSASGSTRTFSGNMERLRDNFNEHLNQMPRLASGRRFDTEVLRQQARAYRTLGRRVDAATARTDGFGVAARLLRGTRRGGLVGLSVVIQDELGQRFPELRRQIGETLPVLGEFGGAAFEGAQQIAPLLVGMRALKIEIPGLGGAMRLLFNPITLIAGGLYLLIRYWDRIEPMLEVGARAFRDWSRSALESVREIDWQSLGRDIVDGVLMAFGTVADMEGSNETSRAFAEGLRNVFLAAGTMVRGMASGIWDRVVEWIMEPEGGWGRFRRGGAVAGVALAAVMFTPMRGPLVAGAGRMFMWLGGRMVAMMAARGVLGSAILRGGGAAGRGVGSLLGRMIGIPTGQAIASSVQASISGTATGAATRGAGGLFGRIGSSLAGVFGRGGARAVSGMALRTAVRGIPVVGAILGVLFDLPQILQSFRTDGITGGITQLLDSVINGVLLGLPRLLERFTGFDIIDTLFEYMGFNRMMAAWSSGSWSTILTEGLWNLFSAVFGNIPNIIRAAVEDITGTDVLGDMLGNIGEMITEGWDVAVAVADVLWDTFRELASILADVLQPLWEAMSLAFRELQAVGADVWGELRDVMRDVFTEVQAAFTDVIGLIQETVFPIIEDLGELFMGVWTDYIQPAFSEAGRFIYRVLIQQVLPAGRRLFRGLGRLVMWWWENVTSPVLETLGRTFLRVMNFMRETGFRVIGAIARFMVEQFFDAMAAIASIRANWEGMVNTMQATSNAVQVIIRNSLVSPLLEAEDAIMTISERIEEVFAGLRLVVVNLVRSLVTQLRDAVVSMGPVGALLAGPLNDAVTQMDAAFNREQAVIAELHRTNRIDSNARRDARNERARESREALLAAVNARSAHVVGVADAEAGVRRAEADFLSGMSGVGERVAISLETASSRLQDIFSPEGRARLRAARGERAAAAEAGRQEAFESVLESVSSSRNLSRRERRVLAGALTTAAEQGRSIDAADMTRRLQAIRGRGAVRTEAISGVMRGLGVEPEEAAAPAASEGPARRRGRTRAAHANRQQVREQQEQTEMQALAGELVIASFGEQAMRQLAQVFTIEVQGAGLIQPLPLDGQGQ